MEAVIFTLVLIGVLVSVACGVWVAIALVKAISTRRRADEKEADQDT